MGTAITTPEDIFDAYKKHLNSLGLWQEQDNDFVQYLMAKLKSVSTNKDEYIEHLQQMAVIKLSHGIGKA